MIGLVIGTRPELIKLRPIYFDLKKRNIACRIIYVEQHIGIGAEVKALISTVAKDELIDCAYGTAEGHHVPLGGFWSMHGGRMNDFKVIVVQGDTNTAAAAALEAAYRQLPVIHVEAGLRTQIARAYGFNPPVPDRCPFPEELNRQLISRVASLHLCPTYGNEQNLAAERVGGLVKITGNPIITVVDRLMKTFKMEGTLKDDAALGEGTKHPYILVTCHRRENWPHMKQLAHELQLVESASGCKIVWIKHPNKALYEGVDTSGLTMVDPLPHVPTLALIAGATMIVTDSGGIIEEATWLGKPRACLRTETERPEAQAQLVGPIEGCAGRIVITRKLSAPSDGSRYAFGDESSALNCANAIANFYKEL